ncbi:MAG TPA: PilZ domain-containing protein [Thermoanaerobaculia bacterium]|nr:PilZ domain-containing protein [Thermoanaerobaculia bacterium]
MNQFAERRRVQRVRLPQPLRGTLGGTRIFLVDVSLRGARIAHQENIGEIGDVCPIRAEWDGRPLELTCSLVRTQVHRAADAHSARTLYHSGVEIQQVAASSAMLLRAMIEHYIAMAMDEQKANARGIPAVAAQSFQTGNAKHYVRHELILGRWREIATTDATQPDNGFTVAASHTPQEVQMLRNAFERGGISGSRDLIKRMAQLSITAGEGIPTRRYMP